MDDSADISKQAKMQYSILYEDGTLKYNFMTSLQKIAMARIVSSLWMNQNTQQEIVNLYKRDNFFHSSEFLKIEKYIFAKVSQFLLPNAICQELTYFVSVLGDTIVNWIKYHNEHILIPAKYEYSAVDFIQNIMWTARGKIDYVQTAKNILANSDSLLSDHHKYKLACNYCLEDEIALLSSEVVNKFYLYFIKINKEPMVYFWTTHLIGMTQLNNPPYYSDENRFYGDMSINEHIMQLLITNVKAINDVPIRFMWNKLSREEKAKNITLLVKKVDNLDLIFSLLSNLDCSQQKHILKECSDAVLCGILKDFWWWGEYFLPTALVVLDTMNTPSFFIVLREINKKKRDSSQKIIYDSFKSLFKWLWQEGFMQSEEFIFHDNAQQLKMFVINALNWERDMDVIEVIFKDLNTQQRKNIAFREDCIHRCVNLIEIDKLDVVDMFIKCILSSEKNINKLKQKLIQHYGRKIAVSFLKRREFIKMDCFMNWAFKSEDEIINFHQSLNYKVPPLTQYLTIIK